MEILLRHNIKILFLRLLQKYCKKFKHPLAVIISVEIHLLIVLEAFTQI